MIHSLDAEINNTIFHLFFFHHLKNFALIARAVVGSSTLAIFDTVLPPHPPRLQHCHRCCGCVRYGKPVHYWM